MRHATAAPIARRDALRTGAGVTPSDARPPGQKRGHAHPPSAPLAATQVPTLTASCRGARPPTPGAARRPLGARVQPGNLESWNPERVGRYEPQIARFPDFQAASAPQSRSSCRTSEPRAERGAVSSPSTLVGGEAHLAHQPCPQDRHQADARLITGDWSSNDAINRFASRGAADRGRNWLELQWANTLRDQGALDESESFIDATFASAKGGGDQVAPTKRGKGVKIMAIVDRHGLPLAVSTHAANHHEVTLVQLSFEFYMIEAKPQNLIGDRAYDSDKLDEELRREGIEMIAPHRSNALESASAISRIKHSLYS